MFVIKGKDEYLMNYDFDNPSYKEIHKRNGRKNILTIDELSCYSWSDNIKDAAGFLTKTSAEKILEKIKIRNPDYLVEILNLD